MLEDISLKTVFVNSFRDAEMTEDLAREIKNEIHAFQHNTDIARFRLTYNEFCSTIFQSYGIYDTNSDLKSLDTSCLYLAYTYVMIEVTGNKI